MIKLKFLGFLIVLCLFSLVGCTDENIDDITTTTETVSPSVSTIANALVNRASSDNEDVAGLSLDCVDILFPFSLVDTDGAEYSVVNAADFDQLFQDTAALIIVDFVYPLNILIDGAVGTADNAEALGEAFAQCLPDGGWSDTFFPAYEINFDNSCYAISYPVSLSKVDGTIATVDNEADFVELLVQEPVSFIFPLNLVDRDGNVLSVGDVDGLFEALVSCNGTGTVDSTDWNTGFEYIGCYQLTFPFNVMDSNGNIITVADHQAYCDLILSGQVAAFSYPMVLIDAEGNTHTVDSEEALYTKLDECYTGGEVNDAFILLMGGTQPQDSTSTVACYTIQYPMSASLTAADGSVEIMTFNSDAEVFSSPFFPNGMIEYPVTVLTKWGDEFEINGSQDLVDLLFDCN